MLFHTFIPGIQSDVSVFIELFQKPSLWRHDKQDAKNPADCKGNKNTRK